MLSNNRISASSGDTKAQDKPVYDQNVSKDSMGLKRVYYNNNVLSLFSVNSFFGNLGMESLRVDECIDNFKFGHHGDAKHEIVKDNAEMVTPDEFKCILDNMLRYQKGFRRNVKMNNITRFETFNECVLIDENPTLLAQKDYERLIKKYHTFYYKHNPDKKVSVAESSQNQQQTPQAELHEQVFNDFKKACKSVFQSFMNTMIHNYLQPYLISEKNYNHHQVKWACEIMNGALTAILTASPLRAGLDIMVRNTVKQALLQIGINISTAEKFAAKMSTVASITNNPLVILDLYSNYSYAQMGQDLAYAVINSLPKFKQEPQANNPVETAVVQPRHPYNLRKRV